MILSFSVTLEGVHITNVVKKNNFNLLILEMVMDIDKSESLSGQTLLLGRKAGCTGLVTRSRLRDLNANDVPHLAQVDDSIQWWC